MENFLLQYSDEALQDLEDIYEYISQTLKESNTAAAQLKRIRQEIRSLEILPKRYRIVDWEPWSGSGMHQLPVDHFIVFYLVNDEERSVQIVRVLYGRRDVSGIAQNTT